MVESGIQKPPLVQTKVSREDIATLCGAVEILEGDTLPVILNRKKSVGIAAARAIRDLVSLAYARDAVEKPKGGKS